jgi:hypothetical protein
MVTRRCASPNSLDFVRAAGETLQRIRLLLVSAYPISRLGPHWPDRLLIARSYEITYLEPDEAHELICRPTPDFPAIYPEGAVDRLIFETRGHPYLIQLVCDELCRSLNNQQRVHAKPDDIQAVIDAWSCEGCARTRPLWAPSPRASLFPRRRASR